MSRRGLFHNQLLLLALLMITWFILRAPTRQEFDSWQIDTDLRNIVHRIEGLDPAHPRLLTTAFPPFQYITGFIPQLLASKALGIDATIFWRCSNSICFLGLILLTLSVGRALNATCAAGLIAAVCLTGPLILYAVSTYNESTAAFVTALFVVAVYRDWRFIWCALLFIACALTKEFAAPLLLIIWLSALLHRQEKFSPSRFVPIVSVFIAAMSIHAAFNLLRFGSVLNQGYLHQSFGGVVSSWRWRAEYFVSLLFAPNGGLLFFWPTLLLIPIISQSAARAPSRAPLATATLIFAMLLAILSSWASPFGWWCWGPRLILPWLPAIALLLLLAYPQHLESRARQILRFKLVPLLIALLGTANIVVVLNQSIITPFFMLPVPPLGTNDSKIVEHHQVLYQAWQQRPLLLQTVFKNLTIQDWPVLVYLFGVMMLIRGTGYQPVENKCLNNSCTTTGPSNR